MLRFVTLPLYLTSNESCHGMKCCKFFLVVNMIFLLNGCGYRMNVARNESRENYAVVLKRSGAVNVSINGEKLPNARRYHIPPGEHRFSLTYLHTHSRTVYDGPTAKIERTTRRAGPVNHIWQLEGGKTYSIIHRIRNQVWEPYLRTE